MLAKVVERGMWRPSLVHPKALRQLHDLTRYRRSLVCDQTREKQRPEKVLEDAQIKLDSIISDLHELIAPFAAALDRLDEIPGVGHRSAQELIAEIGVTMTVFPTAAHLVSWAKFAPSDKQSAGRAKTASTGKGNPWLAGSLGEIVAGLARTDTFLSERYRRLARRRGKKRAIVAVGNSVLTIIWHVLSNSDTHDLGPGYHESKAQHPPPTTQPAPPTRTPHPHPIRC